MLGGFWLFGIDLATLATAVRKIVVTVKTLANLETNLFGSSPNTVFSHDAHIAGRMDLESTRIAV
jgi:hypothetical protein